MPPPGLPKGPTLAMRLWLARHLGRSGAGSDTEAKGRPSGIAMSIESLEHMVRNRVRTFLRHTWLVTILGTMVLGGVIWAGVYYTTKATVMRIAAGQPGSANAKFVEVLSEEIAHDHDRIKLQLIPTDSGNGSAEALAHRDADLAIVPSTVGKSPDFPVVAILRQNVMAFIVPAPGGGAAPTAAKGATATKAAAAKTKKKASAGDDDSKSKKKGKSAKATKSAKGGDDSDSSDDSDDNALKVKDLVGKRIGIVTGNEASADLLNAVLSHYGVPLDKVKELPIDAKDVADAIRSNKIDVLFVAGSATGQAISDTVAAASHDGTGPTFVEIDQADGIAKRNHAFDSASVDAGTFGGNPPEPDADLSTLSFGEYLVARKGFSHSAVAELAKVIYTSRLSLAAKMAGEVKIEAPATDKDADVLVHQGALDYLNDNQQSFFDRYGDDIFYGMLIFPVFGSAIAGVASYLRNDSRTRRLRLLQRVLDLVRKAHHAQTLEGLEQLQIDADNLVIGIVHLSEHEEFDETVRMSFSFALDQLRFAIAARRTAILDHAGENKGAGSGTGSSTGSRAA
jgi:TRAP-type uncharacterized transport system substrate-binding protein